MTKLAINGGPRVRTRGWPRWPVCDSADVYAVAQVCLGGSWSGGRGSVSSQAAAAFARLHDAEFGTAVSSGTAALHVALRAAGVGPGDEVILPVLTFYATAAPVIHLAARPVLVDVDPGTYCIDPLLVAGAISHRTRAIIVVHLYSQIADLEALTRIARDHGISVIEDCGHMPGGQWSGRGVGSWGLAGCFSLTQAKALTAGEGGMIITTDQHQHLLHRALSSGAMPAGEVQTNGLAYSYRFTELQAALLQSQLARLPEMLARRESNMRLLDRYLSETAGVEVLKPYPRVTRRSCYRYVFKYTAFERTGLTRELFAAAVQAEGIPIAASIYMPLHRLPLYTPYEQRLAKAVYGHEVTWEGSSFPVAERATDYEGCTLHQSLLLGEPEDMADIAEAIMKVIAGARRCGARLGAPSQRTPMAPSPLVNACNTLRDG